MQNPIGVTSKYYALWSCLVHITISVLGLIDKYLVFSKPNERKVVIKDVMQIIFVNFINLRADTLSQTDQLSFCPSSLNLGPSLLLKQG